MRTLNSRRSMRLTTSASGSWMNASVRVHASRTCSNNQAQAWREALSCRSMLAAWTMQYICPCVQRRHISGTAHLQDQQRCEAPHPDACMPAKRVQCSDLCTFHSCCFIRCSSPC
jgi:hypothetical protein